MSDVMLEVEGSLSGSLRVSQGLSGSLRVSQGLSRSFGADRRSERVAPVSGGVSVVSLSSTLFHSLPLSVARSVLSLSPPPSSFPLFFHYAFPLPLSPSRFLSHFLLICLPPPTHWPPLLPCSHCVCRWEVKFRITMGAVLECVLNGLVSRVGLCNASVAHLELARCDNL